jgi:porin
MKTLPLWFLVVFGLAAAGQSTNGKSDSSQQSTQALDAATYSSLAEEPDDLRQELDRDAVALSRIPADPILKTDPFGIIFNPFEELTDWINKSARLKISETYTFVSQYATAT